MTDTSNIYLKEFNRDVNSSTKYHELASIGDDFIAIHAQTKSYMDYHFKYIYAFHWSGKDWVKTGDILKGYVPFCGSNYFATTPDDEHKSYIYTWSGYEWNGRKLSYYGSPNLVGDNGKLNMFSTTKDFFVGYFFNNIMPIGRSDLVNIPNGDWPNDTIGVNSQYPIHPNLGDNFYALKQWHHDDPQMAFYNIPRKFFLKAGVWNGKKWKEFLIDDTSVVLPDDRSIGAMFTANSCLGILSLGVKDSIPGKCQIFQKVQDQIGGSIVSYIVDFKRIENGLGDSLSVTTYKYFGTEDPANSPQDSANYDTRYGIAKYNKVRAATLDNGYTEFRIFNRTHADSQHVLAASWEGNTEDSYRYLDGRVYDVKQFNQSDKLVSHTQTQYKVHWDSTNWPVPVCQVRNKKVINSVNNLSQYKKQYYNNKNGIPYLNVSENSDGTKKYEKVYFAFEDSNYTAMGPNEAYILAAPSQSILFEKPANDTNTTPFPSDIRLANATTWSKTLGCTGWVPHKTYEWKSPFKSNGTPLKTFAHFSHSNGASNPNWIFMSSNDKYNSNGLNIQSTNSLNVSSSVILSNDNTLQFASVTNSKHNECFFSSFEEEIAWSEHFGDLDYVNNKCKTGKKAGKLTSTSSSNQVYAYAPWNTLDTHLPEAKKYTFSGWVYSTGPHVHIYFFASKTDKIIEANNYTFDSLPPGSNYLNKWVFLQKTFSAPDSTKYLTIRIDNRGKDGGSEVYFDDIKYYPSDAMMNVTYYDPKWDKPILSVDANENPSDLIEYDNLGRESKVWFIDKTADAASGTYKKVYLNKSNYYNMTENE